MRRALTWLLAVLALSLPQLGLAQDAQPTENDYRIVPAQRVGKYHLGKPLNAFDLGQATWQSTVSTTVGLPFRNIFQFDNHGIRVDVCKSDGLVFAVFANIDSPDSEAEASKYKTAEGIGTGASESDVVRLLGRPESTAEWAARHRNTDIRLMEYRYPGLHVRINASDGRVLAVGAVTRGGFAACERSVIAKPILAQTGVPLPADLRILPPAPQVPPEAAVFSGRWIGVWGGTALDHVLVVEQINPDLTGVAIYAWGTAPQWNILRPGWIRASGTFVKSELHLTRFANGALVVYRRVPTMRGDRLTATYELGGQLTRATMIPLKD